MLRASDLFGMPVMTQENRNIGTVGEILVDLDRGRLRALVMPVKILAEPDLIPAEKILSMGPDKVRLASEDIILRGEAASHLRQGNFTLERIRTLTVVTDADNRLGQVEDLILDQNRVVSLELSDGLIQDIFQGREEIPLMGKIIIQEDKIIVPEGSRNMPEDGSSPDTWHRTQDF